MRTPLSNFGHGSPTVLDHPTRYSDEGVLELEALTPGQCVAARDGSWFIRTTLICFGFCDLATGELCSARDICAHHGGIGVSNAPPRSTRRHRNGKTPVDRLGRE